MRLIALILVVVSCNAESADPPWPVDFGGPFALIDQDGQPRTDEDLLGRPFLISFGYTHCPDVCPIVLTTMVEAREMLAETVPDLDLVFVSIDPSRDTPSVLAEHLDLFEAGIIGLTGDDEAVAAAASAYRVGFHRIDGSESAEPEEYYVMHTPSVFLMGADGAFLSLFPYGTDAARMAAVVREHVEF